MKNPPDLSNLVAASINNLGTCIPSTAPPLNAISGSKFSTSIGNFSSLGIYGGFATTKSALISGRAVETSSTTTLIGRSYFAMFLFNHSAAAGDFSTATKLTFNPFKLASVAIAIHIAPLPAPSSIMLLEFSLSGCELRWPMTRSTINSVSGLGIKTPSPTSSSRYLKAALPVMY